MVLIQVDRMEDKGCRETDWIQDRPYSSGFQDRTYCSGSEDKILGYNRTWY